MAKVAGYRDEILFDKAERKLQREARGGLSDRPLLPVEQLYLQAVDTESTSPDAALSTLQSLIDLYAENAPEHASNGTANSGDRANGQSRAAVVVQLARRRLAELQKDIAKRRDVQLAEIQERLETASRLVASDPTEGRSDVSARSSICTSTRRGRQKP